MEEVGELIIEGNVLKRTNGVFLVKKSKWCTLYSNGVLRLYKSYDKKSYTRISFDEYDEFDIDDENKYFRFTRTVDGHTITLYPTNIPSLEDWVQKIRIIKSKIISVSHRHELQSGLDDCVQISTPPHPINIHPDSIEIVQAGGEETIISGYVHKRGGAHGGWTAFRKRWLVLTASGRVSYFKTEKTNKALGQFSLSQATFASVKDLGLNVATSERIWELQFYCAEDRDIWLKKFESTKLNLPKPRDGRSVMNASFRITSLSVDPSTSTSLVQRNSKILRESVNDPNKGTKGTKDTKGTTTSPQVDFHVQGSRLAEGNPAQVNFNDITVGCVTWNLAESLPKMDDIKFLKRYRFCSLLAIGVQECQPVSRHMFTARDINSVDVWVAMIGNVLGNSFTMIASQAMGAIHICLFATQTLVSSCQITDIKTAFVPCGVGNVLQNKGGVGIALDINNRRLAFICAHFAANREKVEERNQDYHRISLAMADQLQKIGGNAADGEERPTINEMFDLDYSDLGMRNRASTYVTMNDNPLISESHNRLEGQLEVDILASTFHQCFFFGDLNYRLEAEKMWVESMLTMADRMLCPVSGGGDVLPSVSGKTNEIADPPAALSSSINLMGETISRREALWAQVKYSAPTNEAMTQVPFSRPMALPDPNPSLVKISEDKENGANASQDQDVEGVSMLLNLTLDTSSDEEEDDEKSVPKEEQEHEKSHEDGKLDEVQLAVEDEQAMDEIMQVIATLAAEEPPTAMHESHVEENPCDGDVQGQGQGQVAAGAGLSVTERPAVEFQTRRATLVRSASIQSLKNFSPLSYGHHFTKDKQINASQKQSLDFFKQHTGFLTAQDVFRRLLSFDQLRAEKKKGLIFRGFDEAPISFKPSYKFDPYTDQFDTGKKNRTPAWCDRIMYITPKFQNEVSILAYECMHGLYHSDHRPVVGVFSIKLV